MLAALKKLLAPAEESVDKEQLLQQAAAILMLEVARADDSFDPEERAVLLANIAASYQLTQQQCQQLLEQAETQSEQLLSIQSLTRLLVNECSAEQRQGLLVQLWQVAYADGNADKYEEHIIRRIADLLYVPHTGFIQAKLAAESQA